MPSDGMPGSSRFQDNTTMIDPATGKRVDAMRVGIHQRKWEMDSLASVLKLGRLCKVRGTRARARLPPPQGKEEETATATP